MIISNKNYSFENKGERKNKISNINEAFYLAIKIYNTSKDEIKKYLKNHDCMWVVNNEYCFAIFYNK